MATQPINVVIRWAPMSGDDMRRAQSTARSAEGLGWVPAARQIAKERMAARGAALGELASELLQAHRPAVHVSQVLLETKPGSERPEQRWMIRILGDHLPGGYCEVPIGLELEADAARHVLEAHDAIGELLQRGIRFPRGQQ